MMYPELPVAYLAALADPYTTVSSCLWDIKTHRELPTGFLYPCELDTRLAGSAVQGTGTRKEQASTLTSSPVVPGIS